MQPLNDDIVDEFDTREIIDIQWIKLGIEDILNTLSPREKLVVKSLYFDCVTRKQLANKLRVSRERIRQIESKCLRKLRHPKRLDQWERIFPEIGRRVRSEIEREEQEFLRRIEQYREEREPQQEIRRQNSRTIHVSGRLEFPEFSNPLVIYKPSEPSKTPPSCVELGLGPQGYYLINTRPGWNISRDRDPTTYDSWLQQLVDKQKEVNGC